MLFYVNFKITMPVKSKTCLTNFTQAQESIFFVNTLSSQYYIQNYKDIILTAIQYVVPLKAIELEKGLGQGHRTDTSRRSKFCLQGEQQGAAVIEPRVEKMENLQWRKMLVPVYLLLYTTFCFLYDVEKILLRNNSLVFSTFSCQGIYGLVQLH